MDRYWVTTGSTNVEAVVNPLAAACTEWEYVPNHIYLLSNPGVESQLDRVIDLVETIVEAYGGDTPTVECTSLESETNFQAIVDHFRSAIEAAKAADGEVVVDVTPGRKFMSAIAFQAGIQFEATKVCYLHVHSGKLFGRVYVDLPRSATTLYDFREVFA